MSKKKTKTLSAGELQAVVKSLHDLLKQTEADEKALRAFQDKMNFNIEMVEQHNACVEDAIRNLKDSLDCLKAIKK